MENLAIFISPDPDDEGEVCTYYTPKSTLEDTMQCYHPMVGRYVTVKVSFRKALILCDVQVNGETGMSNL